MKRHALVSVVALSILVGGGSLSVYSHAAQPEGADLSAKPAAGDPVGEARFAWYLFVQAMTPSSGANGPLTFENWVEQCQLNPSMIGCPAGAAAKGRVLHASALAMKTSGAKAALVPGIECNAMAQGSVGGYPVPANVAPNAAFCEEVFVNPPEVSFVTQNGLTTLSGQQKYGGTQGGAITFPWEAVEIKADWVPASSYKANQTFKCPDTTGTLYTEVINGTCYALVGFHISSKVLPDWLWATFEPNSPITNPNRCDPKLYNTCFDPWGTTSNKPYGKGQPVPQSPQLKQAMATAGLNKAFNNYFLTGAQTQFVSNGKPVPMGSSFVEFNAQVPPGQASCITCHRYAYFDGKKPAQGNPENNFGGPPSGWPSVGYACNKGQTGNCTPVAPNSTSQDFSWMLGLMPY
jgi:hypothetical protein